MFDIGFQEILLISVIALLVLGPERLPVAVRTISLWIGRIRRGFAEVKTELEREIGMDDIRAQLHNEQILKQLEETGDKINSIAGDAKNALETINNPASLLNDKTTGDASLAKTTGDASLSKTTGDASLSKTTGDASSSKTTGDAS